MNEDDRPAPPAGEDAYDDMRVAGWEEFRAARDRFLAGLAATADGETEGVSLRRSPSSGSTCP